MISAVCPIKNEEDFLPIHIENLIDKVDEIIYCDTGCEDKSIEIIQHYQSLYPNKIKLVEWKISEAYKWEEGKVRQHIVKHAKNNFILITDADEVLSDNFSVEIMKQSIEGKLVSFRFLPFWKNLKTLRCNAKGDLHWYPNPIYRIFDRRSYTYKEEGGNHSFLKPNNGKSEVIDMPSINLLHLHYGLFKRCKPNDNRLGDLNLLDYWQKNVLPDSIPDINFDFLPDNGHPFNTIPYTGEYPKCLNPYL